MTIQEGKEYCCPLCLIILTPSKTLIRRCLQDLGEAELLAVVHSTGYPTAIGAVSVINHFFGRDDILLGAFKGEFGKEVISPELLRETFKKKNWDESVRLTDWVDPPSPSHESVRKM